MSTHEASVFLRRLTRQLTACAQDWAGLRVALLDKGQRSFASQYGPREKMTTGEDSPPVRLLGLTKLLTASVLARAVRERTLSWVDPIATCAPFDALAARDCLEGVLVHHLVDPSRGFDDAMLTSIPRRPDARIDVERLVGMLDGTRRTGAGLFTRAGDAGAWLAAALIEAIFDAPVGEVLHHHLCDSLGIRASFDRSSFCPARDPTIRLTLPDLLTFLSSHFHLRIEEAPQSRFPGAPPGSRGVRLGWRELDAGWFGAAAGDDAADPVGLLWNARLNSAVAFTAVLGRSESLMSEVMRLLANDSSFTTLDDLVREGSIDVEALLSRC